MAVAIDSRTPTLTTERELRGDEERVLSKSNIVTILHPPHAHARAKETRPGPESVFICDEETSFYGECLKGLVFDNCKDRRAEVLEFGAGDGTAVIQAILQSRNSKAHVRGFEINPKAAALAQRNVATFGVAHKYKVHNSCFFKGAQEYSSQVLISNPPYLPAPDDNITMPQLFGGTDGGGLTRTLLSLGMEEAMLLVPAYSDPIKTMEHARAEGYSVVDYMETPLPFGVYSSEPKVYDWIKRMRQDGRAYFSDRSYKLLGILFRKRSAMAGYSDRYNDALDALTSVDQ